MILDDTGKTYIMDDVVEMHYDYYRLQEIVEKIKKELKLSKSIFETKVPLASLGITAKKESEYKLECYRVAY